VRARILSPVVLTATLLSCTPTKLLKATTAYSTLSTSVTASLATAPGLVTGACRLRAKIEYLTTRVEPTVHPHDATFDEFYIASWKAQCDAYRAADDAFAKVVHSIGAYGSALGAFASQDLTSDVKDVAKSAADDAARASAVAGTYKTALEGIGTPLDDIVGAIANKWRAKELRKLVDRTDAPLQVVIGKLEVFVAVLRTEQVQDLREALANLEAEWRTHDPAIVAMVDVVAADEITDLDGKLVALSDALHKLADAHGKLKKGWDKGEGVGLDTIKEVGHLADDVDVDLRAFERGK
jgi:hypothetical protein